MSKFEQFRSKRAYGPNCLLLKDAQQLQVKVLQGCERLRICTSRGQKVRYCDDRSNFLRWGYSAKKGI